MSIASDIILEFPTDVATCTVDKQAELHGEPAIEVYAILTSGKTVTAKFTKEARKGFGGVEFAGPKDVVGLMKSKIQSVLDGTAE